MSDFARDLVGRPFDEGALVPDRFYCYGLVRWVLGTEAGVWLPEGILGWRRFVEILPFGGATERLDVLLLSEQGAGLADHVGICDGRGNFLHADKKKGQVVCEPVSRHARKILFLARLRRAA